MRRIVPIFLVGFILTSCTDTKKKSSEQTASKAAYTSGYQLDILNTTVQWTGFKTEDKVAVKGAFKVFQTDRDDQFFPSVKSLLEGMKFSINTSSSESGDPLRDENLRDYFFKFLTDSFSLEGRLGKLEQGKISIVFDMLGFERTVQLPITYTEEQIIIEGSISLIKDLGADKAFESIHKKCYQLHSGKTWQEVSVWVKILLLKH